MLACHSLARGGFMNLVFVAAVATLQASFESLALPSEASYSSSYLAGSAFYDSHSES